MLMIRLQRIGRKHEPAFRLVLTDSKNSTKSGKFLEILGNYDSRRGEKSEFKADRISYWMDTGAQLSTTVHNLLIDKKIITGKKINNLPKKTAIKPEEVEAKPKAAAPAAETPVEEPAVENAPVEETPAEVTTPESTPEETAPSDAAVSAPTEEVAA